MRALGYLRETQPNIGTSRLRCATKSQKKCMIAGRWIIKLMSAATHGARFVQLPGLVLSKGVLCLARVE